MIRLLILAALGFAIGLFIVKLLSRQQDDNAIDGEVVDVGAKPRRPSFLPILLLGAVLARGLFYFYCRDLVSA